MVLNDLCNAGQKKKTILNLWGTLSPSDFVRRPLNNIKKKKKTQKKYELQQLEPVVQTYFKPLQ